MAMDPTIGAALIKGAGDLISGFLGSSAQESANQTNIQLQREQQAWQESMWNKQNEYNSPVAQIKRMKEAGLNPALMYSQGDTGNAGSVGSVPSAHVQPVTGMAQGIGNLGDTIFNAMIQNEQVKQMRAQTKLMEAKSIKEENSTMTAAQYWNLFQAKTRQATEGANYLNSRTAGQDIYNMYEPYLLANQRRHGELSNTELNVRTALECANFALNVKNYELRKRMTDAQYQYTMQAIKMMQQKYDVIDKLTPEQYNNLVENTAKTVAETERTKKETGQLDEKLTLLIVDRVLKGLDIFVPDNISF